MTIRFCNLYFVITMFRNWQTVLPDTHKVTLLALHRPHDCRLVLKWLHTVSMLESTTTRYGAGTEREIDPANGREDG